MTGSRVDSAMRDHQRARRWEWFWWLNLPVVCVGYWLVSKEPPVEKAILTYLAAASIIALAVSYASKAAACKAEAAGHENP